MPIDYDKSKVIMTQDGDRIVRIEPLLHHLVFRVEDVAYIRFVSLHISNILPSRRHPDDQTINITFKRKEVKHSAQLHCCTLNPKLYDDPHL